MKFEDIIYEKYNGRAKVTINRPKVFNAFSNHTLCEMIEALVDAWTDKSVAVVVITGAGEKAFCTGGDQSIRTIEGYATGEAGTARGYDGLEKNELANNHALLLQVIRTMPKPVIAAVNGYAIGGGNVIAVVCDLTIAADNAQFGQAGPRVGSFDAGYGSAYLARIIGDKKAREIWYLCERYTAEQCKEMGLVNWVVPKDKLAEATDKICDDLIAKSPTSLATLKASFNADSESIWGIHTVAGIALNLYYNTEESVEGNTAFREKRPPDFSRFRK